MEEITASPADTLLEERQKPKTHRLCHFYEAIFNLIVVIRQYSNEEVSASETTALDSLAQNLFSQDVSAIKEKIRTMISEASHEADKAGYSPSQIEDANFAVVAFIDEAIAFSNWENKNKWATSKLQVEYFDRFDAGKDFFVRLNRLMEAPHQNKDVLELYYLCMGIGFKGENYNQPDKLHSLKFDTFRKLEPLSDYTDRSLSVMNATSNPKFEVMREVHSWLIFGIAAAVILLLWMIAYRMA